MACAKAQADQARLSDMLAHQAVAQKRGTAAETAFCACDRPEWSRPQCEDKAKAIRLELLGITGWTRCGQTVTVTSPLAGNTRLER
jgi:hypothetical protein